ncbi:MAG: glycosyltransferase family 4 protein [Fimbriimonadia bacterium]
MSDRPLRVLQIVSSTKNSGGERHVQLLARMLHEAGHRVTVACPSTGWLERDGFTVLPLKMRGMGFVAGLRTLLRDSARDRYDVVHTHLTRATYLGWLFSALSGVPQVATAHVFTRDPVYRLVARRGSRIIAVSAAVRDSLITTGVRADAIDLVHNGTEFLADSETTGDVRSEFGIPPDARIIGLVGRIAREKGHLVALDAARKVIQSEGRARFLFVGRIEPNFREEFETSVARHGLGGHVVVTGDRNDVARLMDAMEIVLLPSEKETFGMVAIEAMARGRPVIATRTGGLEEVVVDKETGLLIEQDSERLADAIRLLLSDDAQRIRMGDRGRQRVRENFTHTRMVERIEAVYARAIGRSSAGGKPNGSG